MARGSLKQRKGTKNKWDGRIDIPGIDDKRKQLCKTFTANKLADAEKQFNKWVSEVQASRKDYLNNDIKLCSLYESWFQLLFTLILKARKLTVLPDRQLPDIMTIEFEERKRRPRLMNYCTSSRTQGRPNSMVILTDYELVENPESGVFCEER